MTVDPVNNPNNSYVQSILTSALRNAGLNANQTNIGIDASSLTLQPDNSQLSPFAQVVTQLQQLQQSDPAKYQQVTQQIASNLKSAAQTAQSEGNTAAANQLNEVSTDFSNASQSGQLPNMQDLAQVVHGHGGHHVQAASSDSDSSSSSGTDSSNTTDQSLSQFFSALDAGSNPGNALDPMSIILNTLSAAGLNNSGR